MMVLMRYILCIVVSFEVAFAFISPTREQNYICNNYNDRTKYQFQLHATQSSTNHLLELMKVVTSNNDKEEIDSIHDFDVDLANEIQEALQSSVGIVEEEDTNINNIDDITIVDKDDDNREESGKKTVLLQPRPPTTPPPQRRNTNSKPVLPPHTALAQVLANQYSIDLNEIVVPLSAKGNSKITAEDVEYYAWKISQPPCTTVALELAYSLDMDLNEIYDDEDRETIMDIDDVQLFRDHSSSLKMSSQIFVSKNGSVHKIDNDTQLSKKRMSKMGALDERLESKMNKLSQKATKVVDQIKDSVTDGVLQQVQSAVRVNINGQTTATQHEYSSVQDFDVDLASEIEAALSMANIHEETVEDDTTMAAVESETIEEDDETSSPSIFSPEELQSMTCVQLKVLLKRRGLKVSGKKSVLVERLIDDDSNEEDTAVNDHGDESNSPLFFANLQ